MDEFDISKEALKRQTRFLKSVLKLDKNFHIYIHGNRELINRESKAMEENSIRSILKKRHEALLHRNTTAPVRQRFQ